MRAPHDDPTVVPRVITAWKEELWVVRCPFCQREHFHSAVPGPRTADCGRLRTYIVAEPVEQAS